MGSEKMLIDGQSTQQSPETQELIVSHVPKKGPSQT